MKNNGFGLIEILLVIVIIALIFILPKGFTTLPSDTLVEENNSKKNTFLIEVKNVYNSANTKYITEKMNGNILNIIKSSDTNKLELTSSLDYCIRYDNGTISSMKVGNDNYNINFSKDIDINNLTIKDIKDGKLESLDC